MERRWDPWASVPWRSHSWPSLSWGWPNGVRGFRCRWRLRRRCWNPNNFSGKSCIARSFHTAGCSGPAWARCNSYGGTGRVRHFWLLRRGKAMSCWQWMKVELSNVKRKRTLVVPNFDFLWILMQWSQYLKKQHDRLCLSLRLNMGKETNSWMMRHQKQPKTEWGII